MNNKFFNTGPLPGSFVLLALAFALLHPFQLPASAAASAIAVRDVPAIQLPGDKVSAIAARHGLAVPYP